MGKERFKCVCIEVSDQVALDHEYQWIYRSKALREFLILYVLLGKSNATFKACVSVHKCMPIALSFSMQGIRKVFTVCLIVK